MSKIKNLIKSPEGWQQFRTIVIGIAVLIATFSATYFTGWIGALKSAPQEIIPPAITFEHSGDLIVASSFNEITTWQYVGPQNRSTCNESIFDDFLGFGKTFKESNRIRLNFARDNNKYYCFKAVSVEGVAGFGVYHANDLTRPVIDFNKSKTKLTASLDSSIDENIYESNWQHILLNGQSSACSNTVFLNRSEEVVFNNVVNLQPSDQDLYYCFRLKKRNNPGYVYQSILVSSDENTETVINTLKSGDKLYLSADREIKNWAVNILETSNKCEAKNFDDPQDYQISSNQITVINLRLTPQQTVNYCIRAQNNFGIYSYKIYKIPQEPLLTIDIALEGSRLVLAAQADSIVSNWRVVQISNLSSCKEKAFNELNLIGGRGAITIEYPTSKLQIYCWQATHDQGLTYATQIVPATNKMVGAYRDGNQIRAHSLGVHLGNWQYVSRQASSPNGSPGHCSEINFNNPVNVSSRQTTTFQQARDYCFRGVQTSNRKAHYGTYFTAALKIDNSNIEEIAVTLANDLNLTELGRFVLYQAQPKFHKTLTKLQEACGGKTETSCYSINDRRIHVLETADYTKTLKADLIQAARWNYLSDEQRLVQNFELQMLYQQNQTFFDNLLPSNFYANRFYEEEFLNDFYTFLITRIVGIDLEDKSSWLNYYQLFFQSL